LLTPPGVHTVISNGRDVVQMNGTETFVDGQLDELVSYPPWAPDGPYFVGTTKTTVPDTDDKLYTIDVVTLTANHLGAKNTIDMFKTFYDYATWNSQTCSDMTNIWHFRASWTNGA